MSAEVILEREAGAVAELRRKPFQIILDGTAAGSIDRNESIELPVEVGPHTLQVREGRYSSKTHSFDATDGRKVHFRCNGAILWPQYVASFLVPAIGLKLKRD